MCVHAHARSRMRVCSGRDGRPRATRAQTGDPKTTPRLRLRARRPALCVRAAPPLPPPPALPAPQRPRGVLTVTPSGHGPPPVLRAPLQQRRARTGATRMESRRPPRAPCGAMRRRPRRSAFTQARRGAAPTQAAPRAGRPLGAARRRQGRAPPAAAAMNARPGSRRERARRAPAAPPPFRPAPPPAPQFLFPGVRPVASAGRDHPPAMSQREGWGQRAHRT